MKAPEVPQFHTLCVGALGRVLTSPSCNNSNNHINNNNIWSQFNGFRLNSNLTMKETLLINESKNVVDIECLRNNQYKLTANGEELIVYATANGKQISGRILETKNPLVSGKKFSATIVNHNNKLVVFTDNDRFEFDLPELDAGNVSSVADGSKSPMPGKVIEVYVNNGDSVKTGDLLCILEAMKMRHEIRSAKDGTVQEVLYNAGDFVESDQLLVEIS